MLVYGFRYRAFASKVMALAVCALFTVAHSQTLPHGLPVVFVHGICDSANSFIPAEQDLKSTLHGKFPDLYPPQVEYVAFSDGVSVTFQTPGSAANPPVTKTPESASRLFLVAFDDPGYTSYTDFDPYRVAHVPIEDKSLQLARIIWKIKQLTNSPRVIIVAHSMGGLATRNYVENLAPGAPYDNDVAAVVTIDTPHRGTRFGDVSLGDGLLPFFSCAASPTIEKEEMYPTSSFMDDLNYVTKRASALPKALAFSSIVSSWNASTPIVLLPLPSLDSDNVLFASEQDLASVPQITAHSQSTIISQPNIFGITELGTNFCGTIQPLHSLLYCTGAAPQTFALIENGTVPFAMVESGKMQLLPSSQVLLVGSSYQFHASTVSTAQPLWSLQEGTDAGSIAADGTYTPPASLHGSSSATFHVIAIDPLYPNIYAEAAVTVVSALSAALPNVASVPPTAIGTDGANLNGTVNPNGSAGTAWFEYGTTSGLGTFTPTKPVQSIAAGTRPVPFAFGLSGQPLNTKYYYRAAATNAAGTVRDTNIVSFTTLGALAAPTLSTPANGASGQSTTPQLAWTAVPNATVGYRIMMSTSSAALPTNPNSDTCAYGCALGVNGDTSTGTTYTPAAGSLLPSTTYFWEVHGRGTSQAGAWSPIWSFTTGTATKNDFSLQVSPSSQTVTQGGTVTYNVGTTTTIGNGQPILLTAGNVQPGIIASFAPPSVSSGSPSVLSLGVGATVPTGTYGLTVIGTGTSTSHTYPISVTVSQATAGAKLQTSPSSFNFTPVQTVNSASAPFVFSLVNSGGSALTISSLTTSPQFAPSFQNGQGLPITLQPNGGSVNMQVVFIPTAAGLQTGKIQLFNSTNSSPLVISLTGTGVSAPVTTGNIQVNATFNGAPWAGAVYYNVTGPMSYTGGTVPYTYYNSTPGSYSVAYSASGPGGAAFTGLTPAGPQVVTAGGTTTYTLKFTGSNNFAISAPQPISAVIAAGSSAQFQLGLCIVSGATQTINLAVTGLPTGASASFSINPATAGCSATASTATINTTAFTPSGVYSLVFTGTNQDGLSISSRPATLAINLPPTSATQLMSESSAGVEGNAFSGAFLSNTNLVSSAVSSNGRFVAFDSAATNLVANDTNSQPDIFVRDLQAATTARVSIASNGTQSDSDSSAPSISADGRYVSFTSEASNLTPVSTQGQNGIYLHDTISGLTTRVDLTSNGTPANAASSSSSISADGRFIAFSSNATNLMPSAASGGVFVWDTKTGQMLLASISNDGTTSAQGSSPLISADGRFVTFTSDSASLVTGDTNGRADLFVHDFITGTTTRANVASDGTQDDCGIVFTGSTAMSADGRYISFISCGSTLAPGFTNPNGYTSAYIHDMITGVTTPLATTPQGVILSAANVGTISADGRFAAYNTYLVDRTTGSSTSLNVATDGTPGNGTSGTVSTSLDGSSSVFSSASSNLVTGDSNSATDVFLFANPFAASPRVTTLTLAQSTAAGGATITGSIVLSGPAPVGGATVAISSNHSAAQIPATVFVPAGMSSAPISFGTSLVQSETVITVVASYNGGSPIALLTLEPSGQIAVNPPSWDFGYQAVGTASGRQAFAITNSGTAAVPISSVQLSVGQSFTIGANTCGSTIAPGGNCSVSVTFKPSLSGSASDALQIGYGSPVTFQTISLTGTGATPSATVSPATLTFMSPGTTSATATLTNIGNAPLSNISTSISGLNAGDFAISSDGCSGAALPANSSCLITVAFSPRTTGMRLATLSVADNASGSPQTVGLSGAGVPSTAPLLWTHTWGGSTTDSGNAVATDSAGDVYVAGSSTSSGSGGQDVLLMKYDPSGNLLWEKTWGGTSGDFANAVLVDQNGNAYVVGGTNSFGAGGYDVLILKFDSSGNLLWSHTWGGNSFDVGYDVSFDPNGNLAIAAESYSYGNATVLLKFSSAGAFLGNYTWKGPATYDSAYSVTVDSSGNAILAGTSWDYSVSPSHNSILILKYDNQGNLLWNRNWAGPSEDEITGRRTIRADAQGNLYIVGHTSTSCTNSNFSLCDFDVLLLKIDPNGNSLWTRRWGGAGYETGGALTLDSNQNIDVVGSTTSFFAGLQGALLQQYDGSGNVISSKVFGATTASGLSGIALNSPGLFATTGQASNVNGTWTDTGLSSVVAAGSLTAPSGRVGNPAGTVAVPSGTLHGVTGIIDTGGGGQDVLTAVGSFAASTTTTPIAPTVTVTPSLPNIKTAQALPVTIAVNGGSGNPTPTGSVMLTSGSYTSGTTALSGGAVAINIPAGTLATGTDTLMATYRPDASSLSAYSASSGTGSVTVTAPITPALTWNAPAAITYGVALSSSQLNATSSVPGTFVYSPAAGAVLPVGSHTLAVNFTPTDATDYASATSSGTILINSAPLAVTAANASRLYGVANPTFTVSVSGTVNGDTFTVSGTTSTTISSDVGKYAIVPAATGANISDYTVTPVNGTLTITQAGSAVILSTSNTNSNLTTPVTFTATVSSTTTGIPTGTVNFLDGQTVIGSAALNAQGAVTYTSSLLAAGPHSITAVYGGNTDFTGSTSSSFIETVTAPDYAVAVNPTSLTIKQGATGSAAFTVTPVGGFSQAVQFSCSGLPANVTCAFSPTIVAPNGASVTSTLTITTDVRTSFLRYDPAHPLLVMALHSGQIGLCGGLLICVVRRKKMAAQLRGLSFGILLTTALLCEISLVGCSSSLPSPVTPAGTGIVTITASPSVGAGTPHNAALMLTITQ